MRLAIASTKTGQTMTVDTNPIAPRKPKGGAPPNNANAIRHGLRTGQLPPGCSYVRRLVTTLRDALERATIDAHGEVGVYHAASINTAARFEQVALLAQRWLREGFAEMSHDQRLAYAREIAKASAARDAAIKSLSLDVKASNVLESLYARPLAMLREDQLTATTPPADATTDATDDSTPPD